jgi:hypothetical protein
VAWDGDQAIGLVMGYRRSARPDTLVVRQIAVSIPYRRRGIGRAMLVRLRNQLVGADVWWMEARVPASSLESRRLFQSFAIAAQVRYVELDLTGECSVPTEDETQILVRVGADPSIARHTSRLEAAANESRCDLLAVVRAECSQEVRYRSGIGALVAGTDEPIRDNGQDPYPRSLHLIGDRLVDAADW